jgi:Zn-dependent protease
VFSAVDSARTPAAPRTCAACGAELAPRLLVCPACQSFVHAETLKTLAARAERAASEGDPSGALAAWREALELVPPETVQSKRIALKVAALSREVDEKGTPAPAPPPAAPRSRSGVWMALGGAALLLWKFKFAALFVLGKLKWLLLGLSKGTTVFSMLASAGVYWALWGWKFAFGIVGSIYIHEMGHVAALDRLGIKATAPMFIPGIGAFVRMKQYPASVREDARVGLAGPIWGLGAAVACFAVWKLTGYAFWGALAEWGARINIFNLMPLGSLDGGRGFRALSRSGRALVLFVTAAAWAATSEVMFPLVLFVGVFGLFGEAPAENDGRTLVEWLMLIVGLAFVCGATRGLLPGLA